MPRNRDTYRLAAVLATSIALAAHSAPASELRGDAALDSEIVLVQVATELDYSHYRVVLRASGGDVSLRADKDGQVRAGTMPEAAYLALWRDLLAMGVEEMGDARPEMPFADASTFVVTLRVGTASHRFAVYDVDTLQDRRYRVLVGRLLEQPERYLADGERRQP